MKKNNACACTCTVHLLCCFLTAILSEYAFADTATVKEDGSIDEIIDTVCLSNVVVSSLKIERNLSEIPSDINVTTSLDIKKNPAPTISDVLGREPGLNKGGDGIWATGINVRGLSENRLVTLIDRNRVETATDLTASLSMLNVNDIERVEVVKGAQSSIYGSGAVGGIVNIITKDGHFGESPYFNGNFTANYSSMNNGHGEYLSLYGGGRKWYVKVNGAFAQAGSARTPKGILPNSGYNSADVGAIAAFKPVADQCIKIQFQRNFSWDVGIPGGASFTPAATATYRNINRTLASLNYDVDALTQTMTHLNVKAFYQGINRDVEMLPNIAAPVSGASPTRVTPCASHHTFGASLEGKWSFAERYFLTAGTEMWRRNISSDREKYIDQYAGGKLSARMIRTEMPLPEASYTSAGIFAQSELRFFDSRLIFSVGGRFDMNFVRNGECHNVESVQNVNTGIINDNPPGKYVTFAPGRRVEPSWSANAGILFKAGKKIDLTLNLSRSYRSPALEELFKFIDLSGNRIHFGNPALKAEKCFGGDVGVRFHGNKLRFHLSAYASCINDMIVERKTNVSPSSVNDTLVLDNAGRAVIYGAEGAISYEFIKGLKVYAAADWTMGREISGGGLYLPMIPPLNGHCGLSYENMRILGASLEFTAAGKRPVGKIAPGERATDGWWRLDFAIHSRIFPIGRTNLQLFGGVNNITDNAYTNFLATNRGNIVSEPGRNVFIRINFTF